MAVTFGISMHGGALTESVDVEKTTETAALQGSKGEVKYVRPFKKLKKFSLKTRGEASDLDVGVGDPGITGISGGVTVIESVKDSEVNTDFPSADSSGTNYPEAVEVTDV
jgi:hypothetical protein